MINKNFLKKAASLIIATTMAITPITVFAMNQATVSYGMTNVTANIVTRTVGEMALENLGADFVDYASKMSAYEGIKYNMYYDGVYAPYYYGYYARVDSSRYFQKVTDLEQAIDNYSLKPNYDITSNGQFYKMETVSPAAIITGLTKISDTDYRVIGTEVDTSDASYVFDATTMVELPDTKVYTYTKAYDGTNAAFIADMSAITGLAYVEGKDGAIHQTATMTDSVNISTVKPGYFIAEAGTYMTNDFYVSNPATIGEIYQWIVPSNQTLNEVTTRFSLDIDRIRIAESQINTNYQEITNPIISSFINKALGRTVAADDAKFGRVEYLDISSPMVQPAKVSFTSDNINMMNGNIIVLHYNRVTNAWEQIADARLYTNVDGTKYVSGTFTSLSPVIVYEVKSNNVLSNTLTITTTPETTTTTTDAKQDVQTAPKCGEEFLGFFNF